MPQYTTSVAIAGGKDATTREIAPNLGFPWIVREWACSAPPGTDGAILWKQNGTLLKVDNIGEYTSLEWASPILVDGTSPITATFTGVQDGAVQLTLTYDDQGQTRGY